MKRAIAIRHVAFEDLGILSGPLERQGYRPAYLDAGADRLSYARLDENDVLIVLGGPIGAYEDDRYPFLIEELRLIEQCLRDKVPVLGICLGAQLVARALGARVYAGAEKEIGFAPVELTADGVESCLRHLQACNNTVLHWHGDTFDLPAGASRLASSRITPNQAFTAGSRILALQFHLEAEPSRLERWLIGHASELTAGKVDLRNLRARAHECGPDIVSAGEKAMEEWFSSLQARN